MSEEGPQIISLTEDIKAIRKLMIVMLIVQGVEAKVIAKVLGYKSASSITDYFPVRELQQKSTK